MSFTPVLNLPKLRRKGITVMSNFPSIRDPFLVPQETMNEGAPVKAHASVPNGIIKAVGGDGAAVLGLALQDVYDASNLPTPFDQLSETHFGNQTAQRLGVGMPIGVLKGHGFAEIRNYIGPVAIGDDFYVGSVPGTLVSTSSGDGNVGSTNKLPIKARSAGTSDGTTSVTAGTVPVIIEFNFPLL